MSTVWYFQSTFQSLHQCFEDPFVFILTHVLTREIFVEVVWYVVSFFHFFLFQELVLPLFWIYCSYFFTVSVHVIIVDIDCILLHSVSSRYSSCTLWQVNSECVFMDIWIIVPRKILPGKRRKYSTHKIVKQLSEMWYVLIDPAKPNNCHDFITFSFYTIVTAASDLHWLHLKRAGMHRQSKGVDWLLLVVTEMQKIFRLFLLTKYLDYREMWWTWLCCTRCAEML